MGTALPLAPSPPLTPHHGPLLNSAVLHEIANIQLFFIQKNSNFVKLNLTENFPLFLPQFPTDTPCWVVSQSN